MKSNLFLCSSHSDQQPGDMNESSEPFYRDIKKNSYSNTTSHNALVKCERVRIPVSFEQILQEAGGAVCGGLQTEEEEEDEEEACADQSMSLQWL